MPAQILYVLDFYENELRVHLYQELTKKDILIYHGQECECEDDQNRPKQISDLLEIKGVVEIHVGRYTYYIEKGVIFTWEEMIHDILLALLPVEDLTAELKRTRPAREYTQNERGEFVHREKKLENIPDPFRAIPGSIRRKDPPPTPPT